jgi:hypothetical protein
MKVIYEQSNGETRIIGVAMSTYHAKQLVLQEGAGDDASKIECIIRHSTINGEPEPAFYCKVPNGIAVNIGDVCFWRDHERDYNSGFFTVDSVAGDVISMVGGSHMPRHELSRDKPDGLIDVFFTDDKGGREYCGKATSIQGALEVCADAFADNPDDYTCIQSEPLSDDGRVEYICTQQKPVTADLVLKISVRYLLNSTTDEHLRNVLQLAAEHLSDMGLLTGETDAEVVDCGHEIF